MQRLETLHSPLSKEIRFNKFEAVFNQVKAHVCNNGKGVNNKLENDIKKYVLQYIVEASQAALIKAIDAASAKCLAAR